METLEELKNTYKKLQEETAKLVGITNNVGVRHDGR